MARVTASSHDQRYALVTGSASGLGRALAQRLGRERWHVAVADIDAARAAETLDLVRQAGGQGQVEPLDVADAAAWRTLVDRLRGDWPALDLLVNNAGVAGSGEVGEYSIDDWDWLLAVNLRGVILGCHTSVDWLKANARGAAILNTSSLAAYGCMPTMGAYNVAKAGVVALSETLYAELWKHGVSVTVACPAFFQTNLLACARMQTDEHRQVAERMMQQARYTADDIAERCLRAVRRKDLYVVPRGRARGWWRIKRWLPSLFHRQVARAYARGLPERL